MRASERQRAEWLDPGFWERLERLESWHRRVQWDHERAQRDLKRQPSAEAEESRQAWLRYCEVIAALDRATASRRSTTTTAQREFWLEFSWLDQEYRNAVRRLAQFCREHRQDLPASLRTA